MTTTTRARGVHAFGTPPADLVQSLVTRQFQVHSAAVPHRTGGAFAREVTMSATAERFVPRHLRHAWIDEEGRRHVRAIDDEDLTFLPQEVQDKLARDAEATERERQALLNLRLNDRAACLNWWHSYIGNHRPVP